MYFREIASERSDLPAGRQGISEKTVPSCIFELDEKKCVNNAVSMIMFR